MAKGKGGFLGHDGIDAPDAPTGVEGSAGDGQVNVSFTTPADVGGAPITEYRVTDSTGAHGATGSSSPVTVTGLTNGTEYTFNVWAINPFGWSSPSDVSGSVSPAAPIAVFSAGYNSSYFNTMDYVTISSTGNAVDWGDMISTNGYMSSTSNATRGLFIGNGSGNRIEYITFSSSGNSADFGDMSTTNCASGWNGPTGDSTRGVLSNQNATYPSAHAQLQYVTFASTGDATDFGQLTVERHRGAQCASPTRAFYMGGEGQGGSSGYKNVIDYVTIQSTGNATDFGDCNRSSQTNAVGGGSSTRGLIIGGSNYNVSYPNYILNTIDYITFASAGNATDFGDLYNGILNNASGASSSTRMLVGGGESYFTPYNVIQYITIATTGNSSDFGDLTLTRYNLGCVGNAHGGLA